jgi:hypothetical protein
LGKRYDPLALDAVEFDAGAGFTADGDDLVAFREGAQVPFLPVAGLVRGRDTGVERGALSI